MDRTPTALLSAYSKVNVDILGEFLKNAGWNLLGSAGTAKFLNERGIGCRDVAEIVGPPILGHRVVTLSREIHAALLAEDTSEDNAELARIGVPRIDLVYVNLYPLEAEIARPGATMRDVIEKTDIGGPTLLRSAAKGRRLVICRPEDIEKVMDYIMGMRAPMVRPHMEAKAERFVSLLVAIAEAEVGKYCSHSAMYHQRYSNVPQE